MANVSGITESPVLSKPLAKPEATTTATLADDDGRVRGWPLLARLMSEMPSLETYSRFRELNVKNLLYYQVELARLERELVNFERKDAIQLGTPGKYAERADLMIIGFHDGPDSEVNEQWKVVLKIRELLSQYSKTSNCSHYLVDVSEF